MIFERVCSFVVVSQNLKVRVSDLKEYLERPHLEVLFCDRPDSLAIHNWLLQLVDDEPFFFVSNI